MVTMKRTPVKLVRRLKLGRFGQTVSLKPRKSIIKGALIAILATGRRSTGK